MNKKIIIPLVVLVIIVALSVVFGRRAQAPTPEDTSVIDTTISTSTTTTSQNSIPENWKTYQGGEGDITFQAPSDFQPEDGESQFTLKIPLKAPYFNTHLIKEAQVEVAKMDECSLISRENPLSSSTSTVTINSEKFEKTLSNDAGAGNVYSRVDFAIERNNKCYNVGLYTHSTNGEGFYTSDEAQIKRVDAQHATDMENIKALFDQITSTIKFVK